MDTGQVWKRLKRLSHLKDIDALGQISKIKDLKGVARLEQLWRGKIPSIDEEDQVGAVPTAVEIGERAPSPAPLSPSPRVPSASRQHQVFQHLDQALSEGDVQRSLTALVPLLLGDNILPGTLERAASLMQMVGEPTLAELFHEAELSESSAPALSLASAFLSLDDPPMALAMSRLAARRTHGRDAEVDAFLAESFARSGLHAEVVGTLKPYIHDWPDPALAYRCALSAILAGDMETWSDVSADLGSRSYWIQRAAARAERYGLASDPEYFLRHQLLIEYGAVLCEPRHVQGFPLRPHTLERIVEAVLHALSSTDTRPDRVAYLSKDGEVFAQWLAERLETVAIPMTARIPGQSLLIVTFDDRDMHQLAASPGYAEGPSHILQLLKDPKYSGVPAPDIIGILGTNVRLPLEPLHAPKAADRLSPRMMMAQLRRKASAMNAVDPIDLSAFDVWLGHVAQDLRLSDDQSPACRPPYVADLNMIPPEPVGEPEEADIDESAERESTDAPSRPQGPETSPVDSDDAQLVDFVHQHAEG